MTSIVSVTAPTSSAKSCVRVWLTFRVNSGSTARLNPSAVTLREYDPGTTLMKT